jgi:hypothetical protein
VPSTVEATSSNCAVGVNGRAHDRRRHLGEAGGDGALTGRPAGDDGDVARGRPGHGVDQSPRLHDERGRHDDDDLHGVDRREDRLERALEDAPARDLDERLGGALGQAGAAAGGDDDHGSADLGEEIVGLGVRHSPLMRVDRGLIGLEVHGSGSVLRLTR